MKLSSIPKTEPFYEVIKARAIRLGAIKDKEEKKYWAELKRQYKIPDIYIPIQEIENELKEKMKNGGI